MTWNPKLCGAAQDYCEGIDQTPELPAQMPKKLRPPYEDSPYGCEQFEGVFYGPIFGGKPIYKVR